MAAWTTAFESFPATTRNFLRRHWQKALHVRQRLFLSQEAIHLLMASVVGLMGGIINVLFIWPSRAPKPSSCATLARTLSKWRNF
jgi:hypothetical protein